MGELGVVTCLVWVWFGFGYHPVGTAGGVVALHTNHANQVELSGDIGHCCHWT